MTEILRVEHLSVNVQNGALRKSIVHDVSFSVGVGEVFSIAGESGSGKTTLACALTRLLPQGTFTVKGAVCCSGKDLLTLSDSELRAVLRSEIRYVFQEPGQSLNPLARISRHMHHAFGRESATMRRCMELCSAFGLSDPDALVRSYPHQLSIGMLQRILLAMALAPQPRLLIADEPTSAIDSLVKYQMMDALRVLTEKDGLSVLFITHDRDLARRYADRLAVMSGGRMGDAGPVNGSTVVSSSHT